MSNMNLSRRLSSQIIRERQLYLIDYGFSQKEAEYITRKTNHQRLALSPLQSMDGALHALEREGFTKKQVRSIVLKFPNAVTLSAESIREHMMNMRRARKFRVLRKKPALERADPLCRTATLRFSRHEASSLVLSFPPMIGFGTHAMGWRIRAMAVITEGDKGEMLEKKGKWMQCPQKTIDRAQFLRNVGEFGAHRSRVFSSQEAFSARYPDYRPRFQSLAR